MSNLGKWDRWYGLLDPDIEEPFGLTSTYQLGADFLKDCSTVEDWGCGKGWFRKYLRPEQYRGIDGSNTPFADEIVDLTNYRSSVEGIFMRHVLEHNYDWRRILQNAVDSFTDRFVLVVFTPIGKETNEIAYSDNPGVPDISFSLKDITDYFEGLNYDWKTMTTDTQYEVETIFWVERP